jgi:hypothetical protein
MYIVFRYFHSFIAALALAFIIFAIVYNVFSWIKKKPFSKTNKMANLLAMIWSHIQLIFGLILYFISPLGFSNFSGVSMKSSLFRLHIIEHPLTMLIAVLLITIGYSKAKNLTDDNQKYKKIVIFYLIGLILILIRIPWHSWIIIPNFQ